MNRATTFGTCFMSARRRTATWLTAAWISTTIITPGLARAQEVQERGEPARIIVTSPPPQSGPRMIADWQEGEPIPPGYHPAQRMRTGPIIGGAVTLGVLYFISALVAAGYQDWANAHNESNPAAGLFIPTVGPFITITQSSSAMADVFLVIDGAAQSAGAILLVYGLTSPRTVLMRDNPIGRPMILPKPMLLGKDGAGVGLVGSF
jgi:hypothetical protein